MVHRKNRMREIRKSWGRAEPGRTRMAPSDIAFLLAEVDRLEHATPPLENVDPEELAKMFHQTYRTLAPIHAYKACKDESVPWDEVPEGDRKLLVETCRAMLGYLATAPVGRDRVQS